MEQKTDNTDNKKKTKKKTAKKVVFKRKKKARPVKINTDFGKKEIKQVQTEAKLCEMEMLITEWCINFPPSYSPNKFLTETKDFDPSKASAYMKAAPREHWFERRREYQNMITRDLVKSHVDFVAELNDMHLKASKLGLGKALEMLTKLEVKVTADKNGNPVFSRFKPSELKSCLESVALAQKIARTALGLPSDEGSVHVWQQMNINAGDGTQVIENNTENVTVEQLEKDMSYDDVKLLIEAKKQEKQLALEGEVIDAEVQT